MRNGCSIAVIIPALNEERAIAQVINEIPPWADRILVADNGSMDGTSTAAKQAGATVVYQPERGYGAACLAAIAKLDAPDIVVFVDGDLSDYPEDMDQLVDPIAAGSCDMVIASRAIGEREAGALTPQQLFGNWLATRLMRLIWGAKFTDLGPFRAIRYAALKQIGMRDRDYGWTVEMQIRAIEERLKYIEVPARYRRRIGESKVSGTVRGTVMAGYKILSLIGRHAVRHWLARKPSREKQRSSSTT
ncbi:MAG: glycosyltransferase family 2 protein [Pseudomonadota bacterium]